LCAQPIGDLRLMTVFAFPGHVGLLLTLALYLWVFSIPATIETIISTTLLDGYECAILNGFTSASTTIPRALLEPLCPDLVLNQKKILDGTLPAAAHEISVNFDWSTANISCPVGAASCSRPFVYYTPFMDPDSQTLGDFLIDSSAFGTLDTTSNTVVMQSSVDIPMCPAADGSGSNWASCPRQPFVDKLFDGLQVKYSAFNYPSYDACLAELVITCTDSTPYLTGGGSASYDNQRTGTQAGWDGEYLAKFCTAAAGTVSFYWVDNFFMATKLTDRDTAYAYPPNSPDAPSPPPSPPSWPTMSLLPPPPQGTPPTTGGGRKLLQAAAADVDWWGNANFNTGNPLNNAYSAVTRPVYVFEVNQTCSSERIQSSSLLSAALCAPLETLPPYLCTRVVRDSKLTIVSNAWAQTSLVIGGYFAVSAMWIKWKLKKTEEAKETEKEAEKTEETKQTDEDEENAPAAV
jgi:hypothetical protein